MTKFLETASRIVFWVFVVVALLTIVHALGIWLFGMDGRDIDGLVGVIVSAIVSVVLFLLAKALMEMSRLESDPRDMLEGLANVADRISERARAAAAQQAESSEKAEQK